MHHDNYDNLSEREVLQEVNRDMNAIEHRFHAEWTEWARKTLGDLYRSGLDASTRFQPYLLDRRPATVMVLLNNDMAMPDKTADGGFLLIHPEARMDYCWNLVRQIQAKSMSQYVAIAAPWHDQDKHSYQEVVTQATDDDYWWGGSTHYTVEDDNLVWHGTLFPCGGGYNAWCVESLMNAVTAGCYQQPVSPSSTSIRWLLQELANHVILLGSQDWSELVLGPDSLGYGSYRRLGS